MDLNKIKQFYNEHCKLPHRVLLQDKFPSVDKYIIKICRCINAENDCMLRNLFIQFIEENNIDIKNLNDSAKNYINELYKQ